MTKPDMTLSSRSIAHLLACVSGATSPDDSELLKLADSHRMLATLASAWLAEGRDLDDEIVATTRAHQQRSHRYHALEDLVHQTLGSPATVLKGRHISRLYPAGWVRTITDLDLEVADVDQAVAVACRLVDAGWSVNNVMAFLDGATTKVAVDIVHAGTRDWAQVQGFSFPGDLWSIPPAPADAMLSRLQAADRSLLELVGAVARRCRLLARDVLDFRLLVAAADLDTVWPAVEDLQLCPEWTLLHDEALQAWPEFDGAPEPDRHQAQTNLARRRARVLHNGVGTDSAPRIWTAGYPLEGAPHPAKGRTAQFSVVVEPGDTVWFSGPFGSGELSSAAVDVTSRTNWLRMLDRRIRRNAK